VLSPQPPPPVAEPATAVDDIRDQLARDLAAIDKRFAAKRRFIGGEPRKMTKRDLLAAMADLNDDDVITVIIAQDDAKP